MSPKILQVPEHVIPKIEALKEGALTKAEVLEQLDNVLSEQQLEEYMAFYEDSLNAIELSAVRDELKSIHEELFVEEAKPKSSKRTWLMAASILLIGTLAYLLTQNGNQAKTFDDVFEPYHNLVSVRGEEEVDMTEAMRLYSQGKFQEAFVIFGRFTPDTLVNEYYFYRGITALAIDSFKVAGQSFNVIGVDPTNPYWQQTKWYLALAYWQMEDTQKAAALLETVDENEFKYEEGQQLLEQFPD